MARELFITVYLFVFRILFYIFNLFPQKKKTTFVASFGDNVLYTVKEIEKQTDDQVVILKTSQCKIDFDNDSNRIVLDFETLNLVDWFKSIYHLATSHHIFVDNYFGFLAVTNFKPNVRCIQLWHAAGAVKQFGLKDLSIEYRSQRAHDRFQKVYQRFNHVIVGSEKMASIFKESFGINNEQLLRTGIPRTDFFYDQVAKKHVEQSLNAEFPRIHDKKVILYAPTYRDDQLDLAHIELNIDKMYQAFKKDYILMLRLHPAIEMELSHEYPDFVIDVSAYHQLNDLLVVTDLLITDYSSIPFEFALLDKPMIFFAYDLDEYANSRGFWENYRELVPGPIVHDTDALIECIKKNDFDMNRVRNFADQWNQYSRGYSSERLIQTIYREGRQYQVVDQA